MPGCNNHYEGCEKWAKEDECKKNADWMKMNCAKSCNSCDLLEKKAMLENCKF